MSAKILWYLGLFSMIVMAALSGGPNTLHGGRSTHLFGAQTGLSDCNTNDLIDVFCDSEPGKNCQLKRKKCPTANKGVEQKKLCDSGNGDPKCNDPGVCKKTNQDKLANQACNPVIAP